MPNTKLNDQIRQELLDIIKANHNIKDYKLPSERMLSIKFNASRPTVRAAYQKLIKQGYVEVLHGKGYFIKNNYKKCYIIEFWQPLYYKNEKKLCIS